MDFKRTQVTDSNNIRTAYYYPLKAFNASYDSIVMQNNVTSYDDIYAYIGKQLNQGNSGLATAFYTALGRERASVFNSRSSASSTPSNQGIARYIVRYDKNIDEEVTNMPPQQTKIHGTDLILTDIKPVRTGYDFLGWSTLPGEKPVVYNSGGTYSIDDNITLYAQWKLKTYTVSYNANGGTGAPTAQTKVWNVDLKLSNVRPVRTGYDFLGWSRYVTDTIPEYQPGDMYTLNVGTVLYAIWQRNTFTIEYNANGGTGAPEVQNKLYGDDNFTLSTDIPTRNGYTFKGWATTSNATSAQYQPGAKYTANADVKLYAVWELKTYTLTYDANGGSGAPATQTWTHGSQLKLSSVQPTREGYSFIGWNTNKNATESQHYPGKVLTGQVGDMKLYAIWKLNEYTITFNPNGGTGGPGTQMKSHGIALTLSSTKPTRTGYTFYGWATSSTATSAQYSAGGTYTANGNATLYAVWKISTYTVTYNANGGSGAPASQTKTFGQNLTLSTTKPIREGYDFLGWGTSATSTTVSYQPGATYKENKKITLYAIWSAKTYTISYNANGGSGAPSAQTKTHDVNLTLSTTKPTRTGYSFQGWSTSSSATSATYQAGGTYTANGNATLYAVWGINKYTITYNANGGSGAPSSQTRIHGNSVTLSTTKPTRTGYSFQGWSTSSSATSPSYFAGQVVTNLPDSNVTLYAVWNINTYTVTYDANGGTGAPASQTKTYGKSLTLSTTKPTRTGYTFKGWATSANSTSWSYNPGSTYTTNENITLYAVWSVNTYTITYNANGGSGAPSSKTGTYGSEITLSTIKPTRTGYTFLGWSTTSTATSAQYQAGGKYKITGNATLYAVWGGTKYTITYDANGGSGAPSEQTKTYNVDLTLSTTKPTRTGYTFLGWAKSSSATSAEYQAGGIYKSNGNATLYAVWKGNTYTLTYNANGGTGAPSSQNWIYGNSVTLSNTKPTREGYEFQGWSTSSSATTPSYYQGKVVTGLPAQNITLYAVWKINTYTITYNANGGTGAPATSTKTHNVDCTLSGTKPTRTGHTFQGWATSSTATSAQYQPGGKYTENKSITLYAVWKDLSKTPSHLYDSGALEIGDFINYDAGTWTQAEINSIKTGLKTKLVTANGSTALPETEFQFGGFAAGSRRDGNVKPRYSAMNYVKDKSTSSAITGWRVFDINGNKLTLISAGTPEEYYNYDGERTAYMSEYILTGKVNSYWKDGMSNSQNYQKRDWSQYINIEHHAENAKILTKTMLDNWYSKYIVSGADVYNEATFQKIYSSPYLRYQNIIDNYSGYWLAEAPDQRYRRYNDVWSVDLWKNS